jgi:hypothetical protein
MAADGAQPPPVLYQISGEGGEQFNLIGLRDRIRGGMLRPEDEIAIVGTGLWKPASQYAPLARYFSLLKPAEGVVAALAAQKPAGSMGSRIAAGLAYPFTSVTPIVFMVAAVGAAFLTPLLYWIFSLFAGVYALTIIRKSSEGQTSPPSAADVGSPLEWLLGMVQLIAISIISAWPIVLVVLLAFMGFVRSMALVGISAIVMMLYYPASLATLAVWRSIKTALSVQQIFRFIGILGGDYYAVIGIWIVAALAVAVGPMFARFLVGAKVMSAIKAGASVWLTFYSSHLLGWAVLRHRDQL